MPQKQNDVEKLLSSISDFESVESEESPSKLEQISQIRFKKSTG